MSDLAQRSQLAAQLRPRATKRTQSNPIKANAKPRWPRETKESCPRWRRNGWRNEPIARCSYMGVGGFATDGRGA